jgi:undecaprenyl diphosphate synthase
LFRLLKLELRRRLRQSEEISFRLIGTWQQHHPDPELSRLAAELESRTSGFTGKQLTILFGYSGLTELIHAFNSAVSAREEVTKESLRQHFWTGFLPDIDLIIRTGVDNDLHWSDWLLLLQMGNAAIYPSSSRWPEFSVAELMQAFEYYGKHPRKLGA